MGWRQQGLVNCHAPTSSSCRLRHRCRPCRCNPSIKADASAKPLRSTTCNPTLCHRLTKAAEPRLAETGTAAEHIDRTHLNAEPLRRSSTSAGSWEATAEAGSRNGGGARAQTAHGEGDRCRRSPPEPGRQWHQGSPQIHRDPLVLQTNPSLLSGRPQFIGRSNGQRTTDPQSDRPWPRPQQADG